MSLKIVIVEDEPIARDILAKYIDRIGNLEIVGSFENALQAIEYFQLKSCDLLFLDIEIPGIDGLSFLKTLRKPPKVIITTAYRDYAVESFELNVLDYLLKPISFERFITSVNKMYELKSFSIGHESISKRPYQYFKSGTKLVQVFLDDINVIEGLSNYVKIGTSKGAVIIYQKLTYLEKKLPSEFIRIHKSFIVLSTKVTTFSTTSVEIDNRIIPIGDKYRKSVFDFLKSKVLE